MAHDFTEGSDIWVVSTRLFEADEVFHGNVAKYETSEDGTVLYEVHFDDGDIAYDIGEGDDQLYHNAPQEGINHEGEEDNHDNVDASSNQTGETTTRFDFTEGSDIWVVSPRLFEAEEAFHGTVAKYETSEDGTVLYEVHFDDGDVVHDIGIGGDRLYHDEPHAAPNVEDTHIEENKNRHSEQRNGAEHANEAEQTNGAEQKTVIEKTNATELNSPTENNYSTDKTLASSGITHADSEDNGKLGKDAFEHDFEKGSDIWVVSLRLFGTDTPFHGIVDNYELSESGKVLYEIHFDDGDIEIDVGDEGDQLYHEEPERESESEDDQERRGRLVNESRKRLINRQGSYQVGDYIWVTSKGLWPDMYSYDPECAIFGHIDKVHTDTTGKKKKYEVYFDDFESIEIVDENDGDRIFVDEPLGDGWFQLYDFEKGAEKLYLHAETNKMQQRKPRDAEPQHQRLETYVSSSQKVELGLGWLQVHTNDGETFYHNKVSGVTQWDIPRGVTLPKKKQREKERTIDFGPSDTSNSTGKDQKSPEILGKRVKRKYTNQRGSMGRRNKRRESPKKLVKISRKNSFKKSADTVSEVILFEPTNRPPSGELTGESFGGCCSGGRIEELRQEESSDDEDEKVNGVYVMKKRRESAGDPDECIIC